MIGMIHSLDMMIATTPGPVMMIAMIHAGVTMTGLRHGVTAGVMTLI